MNGEIASDGVNEAILAQLREGISVARELGGITSQLLRQIRQRMEEARQRDFENTARLREQRQAWEDARATARETVEPVHDPNWWNQASPREIAEVYEVVLSWREHDAEIARAEEVIREQVREHYGVNLQSPPPEMVQDYLEKLEAARGDEEKTPEAEGEHDVEATEEGREPGSYDASSTAGFDEFERRERMALELREQGLDPELVEMRMRTDALHSRPAGHAVEPPDAVEQERARKRLRGLRGRAPRTAQKASQGAERD